MSLVGFDSRNLFPHPPVMFRSSCPPSCSWSDALMWESLGVCCFFMFLFLRLLHDEIKFKTWADSFFLLITCWCHMLIVIIYRCVHSWPLLIMQQWDVILELGSKHLAWRKYWNCWETCFRGFNIHNQWESHLLIQQFNILFMRSGQIHLYKSDSFILFRFPNQLSNQSVPVTQLSAHPLLTWLHPQQSDSKMVMFEQRKYKRAFTGYKKQNKRSFKNIWRKTVNHNMTLRKFLKAP